MAGVSKHYVLETVNQTTHGIFLDHAAVNRLRDRASALHVWRTIEDRHAFVRKMEAIYASPLTWRKKLLGMWGLCSKASRSFWSLKEYKVRPNRSSSACKFRAKSSNCRPFKKKKAPEPRGGMFGALRPVRVTNGNPRAVPPWPQAPPIPVPTLNPREFGFPNDWETRPTLDNLRTELDEINTAIRLAERARENDRV